MKVHNSNVITFKSISLNKDETKRSNDLLHLLENPAQKEQAKVELFNIFDKHIQKEAELKSGKLYYQEDFLQRMYLTFLESLENAKSLTTENLLNILNKIKPNQEEIKEEYNLATVSLDKKYSSSDEKTLGTTLSEEKILKPSSAVSNEERLKKFKEIQISSKFLLDNEQNLLKQRASGKTYKDIANELNTTTYNISIKMLQAIAKVQLKHDKLPKEYELFACDFVNKFNLNISKQESINFLIDNIRLKYYKIENLYANIEKSSNLLDIDIKLFTQTALKQPSLFCQKPETIVANVEQSSKLLDIDRKIFTQAALKQPQLFYQKPETIVANIEKTSNLLDIDRKIFIQAVLKQPQLFCQKPETIVANVEQTSKLLDIDTKLFTQAALKRSSLFYLKPETIVANVEQTSKLLGIDTKIFTQTALKKPQLFYQKPETVAKKVNIIKYYKQIQGKKNDTIRFNARSDENLFFDILAYLIKKDNGWEKVLKQNEIVNYLKSQNKVYNFTIPLNELAEEFIQYAQGFSKTNFGKQMFKFVVNK